MKHSTLKDDGAPGKATSDPNAQRGDIASLCIALGRAMYKQADRYLSEFGLTPPQFEILTILADKGSLPLNRLSDGLCCACSNVTGIVDRLERDGLVQRGGTVEDRRVTLLSLTEKGRKVWASVPSKECCGICLTSVLNEDEESEFRRILEKLVSATG